MFGIDKVALVLNHVAEEMDSIAAKLGPDIVLSPTGLLIVCTFVLSLAGLIVWHSRTPKKAK